jgi:ribosomal protein L35
MPRNSTKPKLKLKTHRGAKRFKITANGKILTCLWQRHLLGTKPPSACASSEADQVDKLTCSRASMMPCSLSFAGLVRPSRQFLNPRTILWGQVARLCKMRSFVRKTYRQRFTGACRPFAPFAGHWLGLAQPL